MPDTARTLTGGPTLGPSGEGLLTDAVLTTALGRVAACTGDDLMARARDLFIRGQWELPQCQQAGVSAIDVLLAEARRRGLPDLLGGMLRYAAAIRLFTRTQLPQAEILVEELDRHASQYAMTVYLADAHMLRARRSVLAGAEEAALTDAATALALLADPESVPGANEERALAATLSDLGQVLTQLGAHELADEVLQRSDRHLRIAAGHAELLVNALNRLRQLLSWGLRLERAGHRDQAAERFGTAARVGREMEPLWLRTVFNIGDRPAAEQCAVLAAAFALADPGPEHIERLRNLSKAANFTADRIVVGIALGRCLERADSMPEAMAELIATRDGLPDVPIRAEPMLALALSRELARLQEELAPVGPQTRPIRDYAAALEAEMWTLRQARVAALRTKSDNLRLAREHGTVTAQAMSDSLTGLPNRRALDQQLRQALASQNGQPLAVAMVDLDDFKDVNDRYSHATGDKVLRAAAMTLRSALRADDSVARYGGDEFVVLLPGTAPSAARAALERAVHAVAELSDEVGAGVTLSVGVVAVHGSDTADTVISRADSAMYQAKRLGGNRVIVDHDETPDSPRSPKQGSP